MSKNWMDQLDGPNAKAARYLRFGKVLLGYAALCFVTAIIMNWGVGKTYRETLKSNGSMVGPIEVQKKNTVFLIEVRQPVQYQRFSFVQGSVLNAQKQYLFGFGEELWAESGRDSEGAWSESKQEYDHKVTLP